MPFISNKNMRLYCSQIIFIHSWSVLHSVATILLSFISAESESSGHSEALRLPPFIFVSNAHHYFKQVGLGVLSTCRSGDHVEAVRYYESSCYAILILVLSFEIAVRVASVGQVGRKHDEVLDSLGFVTLIVANFVEIRVVDKVCPSISHLVAVECRRRPSETDILLS